MTCISGHGSDAVTDPRNEATRRDGARRAVFVQPPVDPLALLCTAESSESTQPFGVTDGIGILQQRP